MHPPREQGIPVPEPSQGVGFWARCSSCWAGAELEVWLGHLVGVVRAFLGMCLARRVRWHVLRLVCLMGMV